MQTSIFFEVRTESPLFISEFNDRLYQSKDLPCIRSFSKFWGFPDPVEFAPVYFNLEGVELRRIRKHLPD